MIKTLLLTVLLEGTIIVGYCRRSGKPLLPILVTSVIANLITQSMLWIVLTIFFRHYIPALLLTEVSIWLTESVVLSLPASNQLKIKDALLLSLIMNLTSFGAGLLLPL